MAGTPDLRSSSSDSPDKTIAADLTDPKWLSEFIIRQEGHVVNELATSLIGIGALFFAYASLPNPFYRPLIALVGLGGSLLLFLHALIANIDRASAYDQMRRSARADTAKEARGILEQWDRIGRWRYEGHAKYFTIPFTAAVPAFFFWVVAVWVYILASHEAGIGWGNIQYVVLIAVLLGVTYGLLLAIGHRRNPAYPFSKQSVQGPVAQGSSPGSRP